MQSFTQEKVMGIEKQFDINNIARGSITSKEAFIYVKR